MKPINAEEIVRVFNGWLEEAAIRELHARGRKLSGSISTARFSPESCELSLW